MPTVKELLIESLNRKVPLLEATEDSTYYHGSPILFKAFNTPEVFLAKDPAYAKRYGGNVYAVKVAGKPMFETPTILVVKSSQVKDFQLVSSASGNEKIYGKKSS